MNKLITLFLLLFTFNAFTCEYPVKVSVGECSGVLLSDLQFIEASNNKKQVKLKDMKIAALEGTVELMEMRHKSYKEDLNNTEAELDRLKITSKFGYVVSFGVGSLITGVLAKELLR